MTDMDRVLNALSEIYEPDGAVIWLMSPQWVLDDMVPLDLLAVGRVETVLEGIEQLVGGS